MMDLIEMELMGRMVTFEDFGAAMVVFAALVLLQMMIWRGAIRIRGAVPMPTGLLFLLFVGLPIIYAFASQNLFASLLVLALGSAYWMSFPAISAQSPSFLILQALAKAPRGLTESELEKSMAGVQMVGDRMRDLSEDGFIDPQSAKPTGVGMFIGSLFYRLRAVLGLGLSEG